MTTILFIICFALVALAFFLIILLYLKMTQLKEVETKQERLLKEFEHVITSYVMEIKEENEVFLNRIQQTQKETENQRENIKNEIPIVNENDKTINNSLDSIQMKEHELTPADLQELLPSYSDNKDRAQINKEEIDTETTEKVQKNVEILAKDIDHLIKLGLSYEEIAKKMDKGKTEIELLHKFRQNN